MKNKKVLRSIGSLLLMAVMLLSCLPMTAHAAEMPYYDTSSFGAREFTWVITPGDNTGEQFYNLVDSLHYTGYGPDVKDKTYITDDPYDYMYDDGWFWATDCKNRTYTDGTYYVYRFAHNYNNWYMREDVITLRVRYVVKAQTEGAPAGYGGVLKDGAAVSSVEAKPGESITLEVVQVPGHKANVTYGDAKCTVSGNKYTFSNVDRNFTFKVTYEAVDFSTVSFAQPSGATISVNGSTDSPVTVISGIPYTVTVNAVTGKVVSSVKVDGADQGKSGMSVTVKPTAGSKGSAHTVSAETSAVTISVRNSAAMAHTNGQEEAAAVRNIFNAIYLSSTAGYTVNDVSTGLMDNKPVIVQAYAKNSFTGSYLWSDLNIYTFVEEYVDGQSEITVRLKVGNQYSETCRLTLYNGNIAAAPITKEYTAKPVAISTHNGKDISWTSSYPVSYIGGFTYYDSNKTKLSGAPAEPGSYYVRAVLYENRTDAIINIPVSSYSNYIPLTITEQELTLTELKNLATGKVYDGKAAALTFTATVVGSEVSTDWNLTAGNTDSFPFELTYSYSQNGTDFISGLPTDAGSYTVKITSGEKTLTGTYEITPRPVTAHITVSDKTYDGTADATIFVSVDTGIESESISISGITGAFPSADASDTPYIITLDQSAMEILYLRCEAANYDLTVPETVQASIHAAQLRDVSVEQIGKLTYTGDPQTPAVKATAFTAAGTPAEITYSLAEDGTYGSLPEFELPGTYTVYYKAAAKNHETVIGAFSVIMEKAENAWRIEPAITGWTYGDTPAAIIPGEAAYGTVTYTYTGTANDGTAYTHTDPPTKAGNYTLICTAEESDTYTALNKEIPFRIERADYDLSAVKWTYTGPFDYDGKEHSVMVDPNTLPEGVSILSLSGGFDTEVGVYTATIALNYDADNYNYPGNLTLTWEIKNDWQPVVNVDYTVTEPNENGWLNDDFVVYPAEGYLISVENTADTVWIPMISYTGNAVNGRLTFYLRDEETGRISLAATENFKIDTTAPYGELSYDSVNSWSNVVDPVTFDLFYKNHLVASLFAGDDLSGLDTAEYYVAEAAADPAAITDWKPVSADTVTIPAENGKQFVCYIRLTDQAGNVTYLSSDGAEFDTAAPLIGDLEDGDVLYVTTAVTVTDENLTAVKLDGEDVAPSFSLAGNTEAQYVIEAADAAGNTTTVTVIMRPLAELEEKLEGLTEENVTSDDGYDVKAVTDALQNADLSHAAEEEKTLAEDLLSRAEALQDAIDEAQNAVMTDAITGTLQTTKDTVKPEQREDLEQAKEDLEAASEQYENNYTEEEQQILRDQIDRIEAALEVLDHVAEAESVFEALPEAAEPDDEDALEAYFDAKEAYEALSEYEESIFSEALKEKFEVLGKALVDYRILEGDNATWIRGSGKTLTVKSNGLFSKFSGFEVDGNLVDPTAYTAEAGSTVVTLKAEYLQNVKTGTHTIAFVYPDGRAEGTLVIKTAGSSASPVTGDDASVAGWSALLLLSAAAAVLLLHDRKRGTVR